MKDEKFFWPITARVGDREVSEGGLTKREYFALQILLNEGQLDEEGIEYSVYIADKLIEELGK